MACPLYTVLLTSLFKRYSQKIINYFHLPFFSTAKQFEFEFINNSFALRHSNSHQYVTVDASGQLSLTANINDIAGKIGVQLVNRTSLILQGEFGFVKRETGGRNNKVKCNSAEYDELSLTYEPETNTYRIKGKKMNCFYTL